MKITSTSKQLAALLIFTFTSLSSAITGTVTDTEGNALPNISLTYLNSRGTFFTDQQGEFSDRNGTPVTGAGVVKQNRFNVGVNNDVVSLSLRTAEKVSLEVFSVNGRKLFSYENNHSAGEHLIPMGDLAKGVYLLQARIGSDFTSQKFLAGALNGVAAKPFSPQIRVRTEGDGETEEPKAVDTLIIYSLGYEEQRIPLYSLDDEIGVVEMAATEYNRTDFPDYWVMTSETYKTFDAVTTYKAKIDSALECIEIKDSIIKYYGDEITGGYPFLMNNRDNYCLAGNYLVFSHTNGTDYRITEYEQVESPYTVRYWNRSYEVPQELIGTWYLTDSVYMRYDDNDGDSTSRILQYSEFVEAEWAVKITADTVYYYDRDGWECDTSTASIRNSVHFLRQLSESNGELVAGYSNYVNSFPSYNSKRYKKFNGDISPWLQYTVPDESIELKNAQFSTHNVAVGDTLWFNFEGVKGQRYKYVISKNNVEMWANMVDSDKEPRSHIGNSKNGLFNTTKTGTYYIAIVVKKLLDESQGASISVKVETSNW